MSQTETNKPVTMNVTGVFQDMYDAYMTRKYNIFVQEGGSRSGKTYNIIAFIRAYCQIHAGKGHRILICRQKLTWARASILFDFLAVMRKEGLYSDDAYNKSELIFKLYGNEIWFCGLDDPQRIHGVRSNVFWINEAIEATKNDFDQLEQRCEGIGILDYNPSVEEHWIYDSVCKRPDCFFQHTTVLDNVFAPANARRKILSYEPTDLNFANGTADLNMWEIYGLGKRRGIEGLVFTEWQTVIEIPTFVTNFAVGIDWGYTFDPTAIVLIGIYEKSLYLKEIMYLTRQGIGDVLKCLKDNNLTRLPIYADTNQLVVNNELEMAGINIIDAKKGPGSILGGIQVIKEYKMHITEGSMNGIKELKNYKFGTDKNGKQQNMPVDDYNHFFDSVRYSVTGLLSGVHQKPFNARNLSAIFR